MKLHLQEDFNSIKVRLEFGISDYVLIPTNIFQFHKGAIGVTFSCTFFSCLISFQFHKGAIGVKNLMFRQRQFESFQFHKGAIGVSRAVKISVDF